MRTLTPLIAPDAAFQPDSASQRAEARSNMFVMATLYCDGASTPVRVRNLSRGGAMVEGAAIPPRESRVRLSRGSLSACGEIVWQDDQRAGVQFDAAIAVAAWLPGGSRSSHQQRIDEMVQACRQAPASVSAPASEPAAGRSGAIHQLLDLRDTLNAVAEELAGDASIAMAHATALQKLDVAAQALDKLAAAQTRPA